MQAETQNKDEHPDLPFNTEFNITLKLIGSKIPFKSCLRNENPNSLGGLLKTILFQKDIEHRSLFFSSKLSLFLGEADPRGGPVSHWDPTLHWE